MLHPAVRSSFIVFSLVALGCTANSGNGVGTAGAGGASGSSNPSGGATTSTGGATTGTGGATTGTGGATTGTGGATSTGGATTSTGGATTGTGGATTSTGGTSSSGGTSTGGATSSGGSSTGGTGGAHVVGRCDALGAVGQWENVTPPNVTLNPPYTGVLMALVDPVHAGTVYATTSRNGVFRSTDCGATWTKTNTGRNASQLDSGSIWSAVIDPVAPETLYALTGYGPSGLWKTTNSGVDWDQVMPTGTGMPGFVARVSIDPTNSRHLIINFHDNCTNGHAPVCFGETKDGGATWNVIDFPPSIKNGWGEGTSVMMLDAKRWLYTNWDLYYSSDAGGTWKTVTANNGAATDVTYFKTSAGKYYLGAANGVTTSSDGATWSMIANSGHSIDAVVGDGIHLYAVQGFQPPNGTAFVWSATYAAPTTWTAPATPGLPTNLSAGANYADVDVDHHVLYVAIQAAGLWRMVTQ